MTKKYVAIDVHSAMCMVEVENEKRKKLLKRLVETKADELVGLFQQLGPNTVVVFEEGCQAKWLYDLLRPYAGELIVCGTREKKGYENKSDKLDTSKLLDRLRAGNLKSVYQGEPQMRGLKELAGSYVQLVDDRRRVMNRIKAIYRSRGLPAKGQKVYGKEGRQERLKRIDSAGLRVRAEQLYRQLDFLIAEGQQARQTLIKKARHDRAYRLLRQIPGLGPIRVAMILAYAMTPHRFRTKRQFWCYCGLAVVTHGSGEYDQVAGRVVRNPKRVLTRGLNRNRHPRLKEVFKGAAQTAIRGEMQQWFQAARARGLTIDHATVDVARKIAAMTLAIWKSGVPFDSKLIQAA